MTRAQDPLRDFAKLSPAKQKLLLRRLESRRRREDAIPRSPRRQGDGRFPLSFAQRRLWFLAHLEPDSPAYHLPYALRLRGALDTAGLAAALAGAVHRHEALRTLFELVEGEPCQRVLPPAPPFLPLADLSALPPPAQEAEAERLAAAEALHPFDVDRGPHLRATLLRLGPEQHVLLFTMHHLVSDGWSMGVLVREVGALAEDFAAGRPPSLPELEIQYPDYADWQRERLEGGEMERLLAWWREQLAGLPGVLELPADRPRPALPSGRGAHARVTVPRQDAAALLAVREREGSTFFMQLVAAFAVLLRRMTGQQDLPLGTVIANRPRQELEPLIGFFANTLVLRLDAAGDPTFRELLARVRETTLGAYAHQDLPFQRLVEELRPPRDMSRTPLFQVMLTLQNAWEREAPSLPGLEVEPVVQRNPAAKFDLSLTASEGAGGIGLTAEYATDLFDGATVARFCEHFKTLLGAVAAAPDRRISELPLWREAERHQVLVEWSEDAAGARGYLLDGDLQPVPVGAPGQLCLGGAGLARGDFGRPDLAAERFMPDPFAGAGGFRPGDRLHLTGELARRRADGALELLGPIAPPARQAPPAGAAPAPAAAGAPLTRTERAVAAIWRDVLGVAHVGPHDNFFDLGGHSLLLFRVRDRLRRELEVDLPLVDLFRYPDVASLARRLSGEAAEAPGKQPARPSPPAPQPVPGSRDVAVIGMAGRFPGAPDVAAFWRNLRAGVESITFWSREEMLAAGVPAARVDHPALVPARGHLDGVELFDAAFFDYSPREAALTDPQQRLFLECCAEALERAGQDPARQGARAGVWAGTAFPTYAVANLLSHAFGPDAPGGLEMTVGNDKDFLATRVSYKLDLRGPAMTVQTACSSSLVAVHLACGSLLAGECEIALAGGVSVHLPQKSGYLYQEGGILSPDGHCPSFDAAARGTVGGDGVGVVVLKPLAAALADGDPVHAVIRGSALSNDGSGKVGFTAPSVEGQARAVAEAQAAAGVEAASIGMVEAHGSATPLGDPIEVAALQQVFGPGAGPRTCALGSLKSNVGHLDAAAGIAGLIKAILAVQHGEIPPSLHFRTPNPEIDFAAGPFYVSTRLHPWPAARGPRRAGVSSFGLGGTNAHVIVEEPPPGAGQPEPAAADRPWQLLVLSARTETALEAATDRLAGHLREHPEQPLADVAWTLQAGRRGREHRRALVVGAGEDAAATLALRDPRRLLSGEHRGGGRPVAFVFPGLGEEYPGMGAGLYREEPVFREAIDRCAEVLAPHLGRDLKDLLGLYEPPAPADGGRAPAGPDLRRMLRRGQPDDGAGRPERAADLHRTEVAQPAVFALEYALAQLWLSWGVRPQAVMGYSLGEYVAACVAGVLSVEDALALVAERARWIGELPAGAMLAVGLSREEAAPLLGEALSLAAVNGPGLSVVAGPPVAVAELASRLAARGVGCRPVETSHAFHSRMMLPLAARLTERVRAIERRPPRIPLLSNVTGSWLTAAQALDPEYWTRHLCGPVELAAGLAELWREPDRVLVEVGPGGSLTSLALQHLSAGGAEGAGGRLAVRSLPSVHEHRPDRSDRAYLLHALAKLWTAGVEPDWRGLHAGERRRRVELPAYPFERRRFWVAPAPGGLAGVMGGGEEWAPAPAPPAPDAAPGLWWLLADPHGLAAATAPHLEAVGARVARIVPGERCERRQDGTWSLRPGERADLAALLAATGRPAGVLHLWGLAANGARALDAFEERQDLVMRSTLALLRALDGGGEAGTSGGGAVRLLIGAPGLHGARPGAAADPALASLPGLCAAAAADHPGLACRTVDLPPPGGEAERGAWAAALAAGLAAEALGGDESAVALHGGERWARRPRSAAPSIAASLAEALGEPGAPAAGHARPNLRNAYVAPEGELEQTLAGLWQRRLGVGAAGRHDGFFEMGGHSLLATQLMADVRARCGVSLSLADLFDHPTVAELAALVDRRRREGEAADGAPAGAAFPDLAPDPERRFEPFPLTDVQQAYWLGRGAGMEMGGVGSYVYRETDFARGSSDSHGGGTPALLLPADGRQRSPADFAGLDVGRLERALQRVVDRHDMLRAVVLPDGRQRILPPSGLPPCRIPRLDLTALPAPAQEQALLGVRREMSHQVFDPARWPLFDLRAALLGGGRVRLFFGIDVLIGDAWSFTLLFRELARFYADPEAALPPLALSFRDYVVAEAAVREAPAYERALAYWRDRLSDLPGAPELPLARSPAALGRPRFRRLTAGLDAESWKRLQERGSRAGLTPSGLLLAAFAEVLAAWSAGPRFTLTLTLFNRPPVHPQIAELVGDFTSLSLLAVDASPGLAFEARARAVQERLWRDLEHRAVSGVRVLRELARLHGRQVFLPVVFTSALGHTPGAGEEPFAGPAEAFPQDAGLTAQPVWGVSQTPQVWLDHQVGERGGALSFNWDVVDELFPAGMVDAMFGAYCGLLGRLAADQAAWSARRHGLAPAAQLARRALANATAAPLSGARLHDLFAARAAAEPDRPAVLAPGRTLTYGELARLANRLGRRLRALGARPNTLVAVVQDKGWEQAVAALGVLASGAAYLPIEPGLPRERIRSLLARAEATLAVTTPHVDAAIDWPEGLRRVTVDTEGAGLPADDSPLDPAQNDTDLAYVIFTSGSTGQPKGVMIDHRGAVNTVLDVNRAWQVGPEDRVLGLSSLSFDLSVWDLFGILAAGGALVLPRADLQREPAHWLERLREERVTVWNSVPALLRMLADTLEPGTEETAGIPLRLALLSGDWIPLDLPARARVLFPGAQVVSLGGATEASIWSIRHPVEAVDPAWKSIPYGRPMANQTWHVLDAALEPRPDGVPGPLYIGGMGLARGYWRDPERTAASFGPHPETNAETGERLYRTGDLGRWLPDGTLELLGREDFQVKIQGYRIELGEIEAALAEHPGVRAAVAVASGERMGTRRLVAYVVPAVSPEGLAESVREHLRARLPDYMVPAVVVPLRVLPLGPNGKVDRRALPAPEAALARLEQRPPETATEALLAEIWSEVLRRPVEAVGRRVNFFELGGDSLLATRLMADVRARCGVSLPIASLFDHPTVAELAALVDRRRREEEAGDRAPAGPAFPDLAPDPGRRFEPFPLTDVQQAYWLGRSAGMEMGDIGSYVYRETDFAGLDVGRLERALRRVVDRHDMLRAVVLPDGRQRILPPSGLPPYPVARLDLTALPAAAQEQALLAVRREMSHQVFDPARWPLFDLRAALLGGGRVRLFFGFDVLIGDAWSFTLLFRDLARFYADPQAALPPLALSFRDYVVAEAAVRETPAYERALAYWRGRLADLPGAPELPLAKSPAALGRPRFRRLTAGLDAESWKRLQERGSRAGLTPSGILLAAFAEVLAAWSAGPRFTLTLTLFNRPPMHPQIAELVGDFTSLTLLAVDASPGLAFEARARAVQERLWRDLEHRAVSGVRVLRELARVHGRQVFLPVIFTSTLGLAPGAGGEPFAGPAEAFPQDAGLAAQPGWGISQTPQVWLDHQVGERGGALSFNWDVVDELFPPGMVDAMFGAYCSLLGRLAAGEAAWSARRHGLAPAAQLARRALANATAAPLSGARLHDLFAARAAAEPHRPAVLAPGRTLTYGELARLANRLGRRLRALGARPNSLVAVVQDKGWEQAVAALGVLASGAAYLPIEPGLPRERLRSLLARSEATLAVTTPHVDAAIDWPEGLRRVTVDAEGAGLPADDSPLAPAQSDTDLAYVIFTSGSTGQPKGVMIDHRGAVNTILDVNRVWQIGPEDRVLGLSSLSFDLSVWDLFGILAAGGALVLPRADLQREPAHWLERLREERVTVWNSVPALLRMLADTLEPGTEETAGIPLRLALLSGDWIPLDLPARARALFPGARFVSLGGATEASIWSILHPVEAVDPAWKSIPYGRPMANQTWHVLDAALEPRPDGVPGPLYIGGMGLARGYWRDPERTAASFVPHPETSAETGERLYRTGDLGRWLPDGTLELLGREDFQVKIQGYRIELGEIEAALAEHPGVRAAVAVASGERMGTRRLVAYVVPAVSPEGLAESVREHLRARLPDYMVPAVVVPLRMLPLGPNGKLDRRALPAPEALLARVEHRAPETETEALLAEVWSEVLRRPVEAIGRGVNFFELGGDSLLATQVMVRVREVFGAELPLRTFFEATTLEAQAAAVERESRQEGADGAALDRLLEQLQGASPEEAARLLSGLQGAA